MSFHIRLKKLRKITSKSALTVAQELGVNRSSYENWEWGRYPTDPEIYLKLAKYFGVDPLFLIYGEEVQNEYIKKA